MKEDYSPDTYVLYPPLSEVVTVTAELLEEFLEIYYPTLFNMVTMDRLLSHIVDSEVALRELRSFIAEKAKIEVEVGVEDPGEWDLL